MYRYDTCSRSPDVAYDATVPRLWSDTIQEHRREVREAILDTAALIAADSGVRSVTMSSVAEETGIGRATLYKYFSDVDAILVAWHERQVHQHLEELRKVGARPGAAGDRLAGVLETFALLSRAHHSNDLTGLLHREDHVPVARNQVANFVRELIEEGVAHDEFRDDVPAADLASYCFHAIGAAGSARSKAAVRRLVTVIMAGLRPS
jgi:AcrR family transcriptional regulator